MEVNHLKEQIDLFVQGKLQGPELAALQDLIKNDPKVANEVEMQNLVTQAIKKDRMQALKMRLDSIEVPAISTGSPLAGTSVANYFGLKMAAVVLLTAGTIGLGTYLYLNQIDYQKPTIIADTIKEETVPVIDDQGVIADSQNEVVRGNVAEKATTIAEQEEIKADEKRAGNVEKPYSLKAKKEVVVSADFKKGKAVADGEKMLEQKFEDGTTHDIKVDAEAPKEIISTEEITKTSDVDIKNIQDGKHNFHYMLKEGVLFLYGNFEASPYEILEFNEKGGQALYLYYDRSYFSLTEGKGTISKLKKITDQKLITALTEARSKKH